VKLGIDQDNFRKFVASDSSDLNQNADEDLPLNSTSQFLKDNGVNLPKSTRPRKNQKRKSKKKAQKSFSMVKLLSSLPKVEEEEAEGTTEASLPIIITKPSSFQYNQRDAKKFYKNIIKKERSSSRRLKIKLD